MSERLRDELAAFVRQRRNALGLTLEQLAERCSLATDTVGKFERGYFSPSLTTVEKLARGFGLTAGQLLTTAELSTWQEQDLGELLDMLRGRPPEQIETLTTIVRAQLVLIDAASLGGPDGVAPGEGEQAPVEAGLPVADGDDLEVLAGVDEPDARPAHGPGELGCLVQTIHAGADLDPSQRGLVALAGHGHACDEVGDPG